MLPSSRQPFYQKVNITLINGRIEPNNKTLFDGGIEVWNRLVQIRVADAATNEKINFHKITTDDRRVSNLILDVNNTITPFV